MSTKTLVGEVLEFPLCVSRRSPTPSALINFTALFTAETRRIAEFAEKEMRLSVLTVRAVVGGAAAMHHASNFGSAVNTRLIFAFVHAPEAFGSFEVAAIAIGEIDSQR